jgi:hypothetical protein
VAATARLAAVARAARRTLDLPRERRRARHPDRARKRTRARRVHARADLRTAWDGRHRVSRAARQHRAVADGLCVQSAHASREGADAFFGGFSSWGFGIAVDTKRDDLFHVPGRHGWTGGLGTTAYTDPTEGVIGILFTQRMADSPPPPPLFTDFWTLAYAAVE